MGIADTPNDIGGVGGDKSSKVVEFTAVKYNLVGSRNNEDINLLKAIENMFDAKFNKLEQRLKLM